MDIFDACKKLCEIIVQENSPEFSAYKLQFFIAAMDEGDTVKMAFARAKNTWNDDDDNINRMLADDANKD